MMGRREVSVCNLLGRPSVLLLILLPIFLAEGFNVDVNSLGEESGASPILTNADVSEAGHNEAAQRGNTEGRIEDNGSGTRSSSRDRHPVDHPDRQGDGGGIKDHVEFHKTEAAQENRENLGKEFCRLLMHDRELLDLLLNNTYHGHISNLSRSQITVPKCGDGEYPSIIRSISGLGGSRMRELKFYVNQQGEYRMYVCKRERLKERHERDRRSGDHYDGDDDDHDEDGDDDDDDGEDGDDDDEPCRRCKQKKIFIAVGVVLVLLNILCLSIGILFMRKRRGSLNVHGFEEEQRRSGTPSSRHHRHGEPSLLSISYTLDRGATTECSGHSPRRAEMGSSNASPVNSEQGVQTVSLPLVEDLDSTDSIQVLRGKDPFWLVMIGQFGPEGGTLSCEDSDVIVEIPPGAIPPDRHDQLIIARICLCPDSIGPKLTDPDSLWLGPLVELESPGLDRFHKNVLIKIPHRARLQPGWTFIVHYTDPTADTKSNWQTDTTRATVDQLPEAATFLPGKDTDTQAMWNCVEQKWHSRTEEKASNDVTRLTFSVDEKYFNISTSHFSHYVCSGCSKTHPLNLESVVYWHHYKVKGLDQMDLNVYIIDTIKDTRKASVESNEGSSKLPGAQSGRTGYSSLSLEYTSSEASSLIIFVDEECMDDDWKWSLKSYNGRLPAKREMSVESVIRGCCSSLMSTQEMFTFVPTDPSKHEQLSFFQAMIGIKQFNSQKVFIKMPILVTVPLTKGCGAVGATNTDNTSIWAPIISDGEIDFVGERLPCSKWPRLYRKLMGKGADIGIEEIQHRDFTDSREQIHSALVGWRSSKGRMATVEKLITALQQVELRYIADQLQSFCLESPE